MPLDLSSAGNLSSDCLAESAMPLGNLSHISDVYSICSATNVIHSNQSPECSTANAMPLDNLSSDSSSANASVVLQSGYTSSASITIFCEPENLNILVNTTQLPP